MLNIAQCQKVLMRLYPMLADRGDRLNNLANVILQNVLCLYVLSCTKNKKHHYKYHNHQTPVITSFKVSDNKDAFSFE